MNEVSFSRAVKEVKFGAWTLDPKRQTISDCEVTRELEPLLFKILCYLIINDEQIITRQDLVDDVWCQKYVDDNAINRAMSELRKVLKSERQKGLVVKTHYRKGYSFFLKAEVVYQDSLNNTSQDLSGFSPSISNESNSIKTENSHTALKYGLSIICSFAVIFALYMITSHYEPLGNQKEQPVVVKSSFNEELLSWEPGRYLSTHLSPNEYLLAYLFLPNEKEKAMLVIKILTSNTEKKVAFQGAELFPLGWSFDSSKLFYRLIKDDKCEVWLVDSVIESTNKHLFECEKTLTVGAGVDEEHFVYTKRNYRGKDGLSALVSLNYKTGEEFQLTSPSLNTRGDIFLHYEPVLKKIFFQRWQLDSVQLYMTDLEGSNHEMLLESASPFYSINYISKDNTLMWFNSQSNTLHSYSLTKREIIKEINVESENMFAFSEVLSPKEVVVTSYPYKHSIYSYNLIENTLKPFVVNNGLPSNGVRGDKKTIFIQRNGRYNSINYIIDGQSTSHEIVRKENFIRGIRYSKLLDELLVRTQKNITLYSKERNVIEDFTVDGTILSSEFLLNGDLGYVVFNKELSQNNAFIYSLELKKSRKLPVSDIVWFDQLDDDTYLMLSSKDKLQHFDIKQGKVVKEITLNYSGRKHLIAIAKSKVFYSDGTSIFELQDSGFEKITSFTDKSIKELNYDEFSEGLVLSTNEVINNHLVSLKLQQRQPL